MANFLAQADEDHLLSTSEAAHFFWTVADLAPLGKFGKTIGVKVTLANEIACLGTFGPSIKA